MSAYKRTMILHAMLVVLGLLLIIKAERLSDTPIALRIIGVFCMAYAIGKMILIKKVMEEDLEENKNDVHN